MPPAAGMFYPLPSLMHPQLHEASLRGGGWGCGIRLAAKAIVAKLVSLDPAKCTILAGHARPAILQILLSLISDGSSFIVGWVAVVFLLVVIGLGLLEAGLSYSQDAHFRGFVEWKPKRDSCKGMPKKYVTTFSGKHHDKWQQRTTLSDALFMRHQTS